VEQPDREPTGNALKDGHRRLNGSYRLALGQGRPQQRFRMRPPGRTTIEGRRDDVRPQVDRLTRRVIVAAAVSEVEVLGGAPMERDSSGDREDE
jgi:hypothetical protein